MTTLDEIIAILRKRVQTLDDLELAFAERHAERVHDFLRDVALCVLADELGPGGRKTASEYAGWSPQWITRLALTAEMEIPDELITPMVPAGVYWQVLTSDLSRTEMLALLKNAVEEEWSVADAKEAMGREGKRTGGTVWRGEIADRNGGRVIVTSDEFEGANLPTGTPVSVRKLKGGQSGQ